MLKGTGEIRLSKFLALCGYKLGLTETTARKYLATLETLDFIFVNESRDVIQENLLLVEDPAAAPIQKKIKELTK